eukprot:8605496-Pyramimonas_sp.AAC.1
MPLAEDVVLRALVESRESLPLWPFLRLLAVAQRGVSAEAVVNLGQRRACQPAQYAAHALQLLGEGLGIDIERAGAADGLEYEALGRLGPHVGQLAP